MCSLLCVEDVLRFFRIQKNQSTNAVRAIAARKPTTTPAIQALFPLGLGDGLEVAAAVAVTIAALPDTIAEAGEAVFVGLVPVVGIAVALAALGSVTTDSSDRVSL